MLNHLRKLVTFYAESNCGILGGSEVLVPELRPSSATAAESAHTHHIKRKAYKEGCKENVKIKRSVSAKKKNTINDEDTTHHQKVMKILIIITIIFIPMTL